MRDLAVVTPVPLASWPTPLERAPRLAGRLGLGEDDLWIKRDDLAGPGAGGNKIRKLEYLLAEALARGATTVITTGAAQSNHARLTAAAARRLGLNAVLVLAGTPETPTGNLLLDTLLGATIVWAGGIAPDELEQRARDEADRYEQSGECVYVVPFGGSNPLGARGYAAAGRELLQQDPDVDAVIVAVGSGGTMAGLVHALGLRRVLGVDVGAVPDSKQRVAAIASALAAQDNTPLVTADSLQVRHDQIGDGYRAFTPAAREALTLFAQTEGLILDPIYTARAAAGLHAWVKEGAIRPGQRTVLVHTGGLPGLFGHPEAAT